MTQPSLQLPVAYGVLIEALLQVLQAYKTWRQLLLQEANLINLNLAYLHAKVRRIHIVYLSVPVCE
jgi:hypothetical protein